MRLRVPSVPLAVVVLLVAHAVLVMIVAAHSAVTIDEMGHLPAGLSYVERGSFEVNPQPPLVKQLGAAAALLAGARSDYAHTWREAVESGRAIHYPSFAQDFMRANAEPPGHYHRLYRAARAVVLPFSLLLGLVLFFWGRELFGPYGGLVPLALWCFSPNAIAHAALFTSDVPAAAAITAATWGFWRWLARPSWRGVVLVGFALGLAQLVKLSALILYGLWPVLALPALLGAGRAGAMLPSTHRARLGFLVPRGLAMVGISLLVVNAGYGFAGSGTPLGEADYMSTLLTSYRSTPDDIRPDHVYREAYARRVNRFRGTPLAALPAPVPQPYLDALDLQTFEANPGLPGAGFMVYLRGQVQRGGWWVYYPYALLVKATPGAWLAFAAAGLAALFVRRTRLPREAALFVWLPPLAMLASMAFLADVDIGVRYALVCVPFFLLGTGRLASPGVGRLLAGTAGMAVLAHVAAAVWVMPHPLAYFSPLVGGPDRGYRHLVDSNLDWGQELLHLRRWLDDAGASGPVSAALYTSIDPSLVGLDVRMIPRDPRALRAAGLGREVDEPPRLAEGLYVVSANFVAGLPFRLTPDDRLIPLPVDAYAYFERLEPVARVGHVLWVYRLAAADADRLNHQLGFPRARSR